MPLVFRYKGYRFFFYSNEGNPIEACHIHVQKGSSSAKFWVHPQVLLANSYEMSPKELKDLMRIVKENKELIEEKWHDFFSA